MLANIPTNFIARDAYAAANLMRSLYSKTALLNAQLQSRFDVPLPERFEFHTTGPWTINATSDTEKTEEEELVKVLGEGTLTFGIQGGSHTPRESTVPTIFQVFKNINLFYIVSDEMKYTSNGAVHLQ